MNRVLSLTLVGLVSLGVASPRHADAADSMSGHSMAGHSMAAMKAPLFDNLGTYHRKITTQSPEAQKYFDQGLRLMYAFNLWEAQAAFEQATRLDSTCAMAWWGVAMSLGPHINLPALPDRTIPANKAAQRALALEGGASDVERALIEALVHRYSDPPPSDPKAQFAMDSTYAAAMKTVADRFPDDDDVQAFWVEGMMDLNPWHYWNPDGTAAPGTDVIVSTLEKILARNPTHPGANHYYIHSVEASPHPEKALASAQRLENMMPGAGHLVHMPSHIYQRVGRYADAYAANHRAVASDDAYVKKTGVKGMYGMYIAHNRHFLATASMMEGRSADAIQYARSIRTPGNLELIRMMPGFDIFFAVPYFAYSRFGRWDDMLKEPRPLAEFPFLTALWHYHRGLAFASKGRVDEAQDALDSVTTIAAKLPDDFVEGLSPAKQLIAVAKASLAGEIAARRGKTKDAIEQFRAAVEAEDGTSYDEPPDWLYPTRHRLGAMLLKVGKAADAEAVYLEDLKRNPENGWSLYGLAQSYKAEGKAEAADTEARFKKAWARADVKLTASSF